MTSQNKTQIIRKTGKFDTNKSYNLVFLMYNTNKRLKSEFIKVYKSIKKKNDSKKMGKTSEQAI